MDFKNVKRKELILLILASNYQNTTKKGFGVRFFEKPVGSVRLVLALGQNYLRGYISERSKENDPRKDFFVRIGEAFSLIGNGENKTKKEILNLISKFECDALKMKSAGHCVTRSSLKRQSNNSKGWGYFDTAK